MGVLKFMRAGFMDPCTIREDVSCMVGLNGCAGSLVGPKRDLYTFIVDLTLRESVLYFEYSIFLMGTFCGKTAHRTNPPLKNSPIWLGSSSGIDQRRRFARSRLSLRTRVSGSGSFVNADSSTKT